MKISDPDQPMPHLPAGADVRILLPAEAHFDELAAKLEADGAAVRRVRYLLEEESIEDTERNGPTVTVFGCRLSRPRGGATRTTGPAALAARDAFEEMWHAYPPVDPEQYRPVPVEQLLPAAWARFLPFTTLNPAQAEALPAVIDGNDNVVIVAPTGAGKTVIGMAAVLRTVLAGGRKAAWLVPQRSLTDELDRELENWRREGLRVERLSGEHTVDAERIREANLWVATTEKFEAICRTSSMRDALAEVGTLVVDEIHLLGDPARGPVLEALLARMRDGPAPTRLIGLSATVSNAEHLAAWLRARLVRVGWRPSRLSWQLLRIPAHSDWNVTEATRTRLAAAVTAGISADGGSVLVFCGSKRNVRRTALVIAASRGVDVYGVHPDDVERVQEVCRRARVGLHYKGCEYRLEAERAFRARELDVLVATSTVAAGVNLPARAVVIRDSQLGLENIDVATVQQMFGRAGRIGAGETEGSAFFIVDEQEHAGWRKRLMAGHTVWSQIQSALPEHVLSEAVQQRITSTRQARQWWVQTLAYHQGRRDTTAVGAAVRFLAGAGMLAMAADADCDSDGLADADCDSDRLADATVDPGEVGESGPSAAAGTGLTSSPRAATGSGATMSVFPRPARSWAPAWSFRPTELGLLTTRIMVSPTVGHELRVALARAPLPTGPEQAEGTLIAVLATRVPKLVQATVGEDAKPAVARLLAHGGHTGGTSPGASSAERQVAPGDLARATLLAVANAPHLFRSGARTIAGIPYAAMYPILEEVPRYLHWLAGQGLLGTVHPWCAVVAADLGRRIRWRRCRPARGAGRLLWMCEQMATPVHAEQAVRELWMAATARGHTNPDWPVSGRPHDCRLDETSYRALLRDRATGCSLIQGDGRVEATGPPGAVLVTWAGTRYAVTPLRRGTAQAPYPAAGAGPTGAAVFTWRGDYHGTGWLARYAAMAPTGSGDGASAPGLGVARGLR